MDKYREETYLPKEKRKKIVLLSDDLRMSSGVGTMSKEFVVGTAHRYNWFQVGAAIQHPEHGKLADVSADIAKETGVPDPSVRVLAYNGYGDEMLIRNIIKQEKPDAILHYTDPRFWIWLYQMEHEVRQHIPILFYHVWDNLPYPMYNRAFYESCDWFGCISKQTQNIVKNVYPDVKDWQVDYIPHGINHKVFFPIDDTQPERVAKMEEIRKQIWGTDEQDFVILYNSRNIRRKLTSNIILAFHNFVQSLPESKRNRCTLILHTQPVDPNGTDLPVVASTLAPGTRIYFSSAKVDAKDLNCLYNLADVTINMSNAEGFGLGTAESLMAGTPIIATVTGGLQDQLRFLDEEGNPVKFNKKWGSNSDGRVKGTHGEWSFPLFPSARSLTGSPLTPYIFDDYADFNEATEVIRQVYNLSRDERKRIGKVGREWMLTKEAGMSAEEMSMRFIQGIDKTLEKWTPRKRYNLYRI